MSKVYYSIFAFVLVLNGCCVSPEHRTRVVRDKSVFSDGQRSHFFRNASGQEVRLINEDVQCDVSDYGPPNEDCIAYNNELCGQFFYESKDGNNPLDFSLIKDHNAKTTFLFSDTYAQDNSTEDVVSLDSIIVNGHVYRDVLEVNLRPRRNESTVSKMIYSPVFGPLSFTLTDGNVWNRLQP